MGKQLSSEEIYEQYIDAATALVMDRYAVAMGERMAASNDEEHLEIPEALDKRCRKLIHKKLAKDHRVYVAKKALRFTTLTAIVVVMLFGVVGILFTTVEAIRVPIINFFVAQKEGFMEISGNEESTSEDAQNGGRTSDVDGPLAGLLPEGYVLRIYDVGSTGDTFIVYENENGDIVALNIFPNQSSFQIDTEDASASERMKIASYDAVLIEKDGYQLAWLDTEEKLLYYLDVSALSRDEIIELAENVEKLH